MSPHRPCHQNHWSPQSPASGATSVGWVGYANFYPVAHFLLPRLIHSTHTSTYIYQWREGGPRSINEALWSGEVEVALTSSINLLVSRHCKMFVPIGIGAQGAVSSVFLEITGSQAGALLGYIHQRNDQLSQWLSDHVSAGGHLEDLEGAEFLKKFAERDGDPCFEVPILDLGDQSQTSATLAVIFYELWFGIGRSPRRYDLRYQRLIYPPEAQIKSRASLGSSSATDAAPTTMTLHLGDRALIRRRERGDEGIFVDLSEAWWQITGLPFVFALWMSSTSQDVEICDHGVDSSPLDPPLEHLATLIRESTVQARRQIDDDPGVFFSGADFPNHLTAGWSSVLPRPEMIHYWRHHIIYDLGVPELNGLRTFLSLARQVLKIEGAVGREQREGRE